MFVDIGHNQANTIESPSENITVENYLANCNTRSMFLSSVEEPEIISIVKHRRGKCTGIDQYITCRPYNHCYTSNSLHS